MSELKIKVKLDENAKMPKKAHASDAGYDLFAPYDFKVPTYNGLKEAWRTKSPGSGRLEVYPDIGSAVVDTGVHMMIPSGYVGMIKSKSGLNVKHGLIAEGVVDAGYSGSIVVKLYNLSSTPYQFKKGDKITQICIMPVQKATLIETDELEETERGEGGFGSSGR